MNNQELLGLICQAFEQEIPLALVTVIKVIGSAYRREGAKMVVRADGESACMISGGCLEPEVIEVAKEVLATGKSQRRYYDLSEDSMWGLGLGCGGAVELWIEPLERGGMVGRWLEHTLPTPTFLIRNLSTGDILWYEANHQEGHLSPDIQPWALAQAERLLNSEAPRSKSYRYKEQDIYIDVQTPQDHLIIFGAGHDAKPLAHYAHELGFKVSIVDARRAFATPEAFPHAEIIIAHAHKLEGQVTIPPHAQVIIMNHHLERDRHCLRFALASEANYVGVLGPVSRLEKILTALAEEGIHLSETEKAKIRNPIGIDIGAEGAEEIAMAVMMELIALKRGFRAGFLHGRKGRIHDPSLT
ncbi:MAG: XdhC family protein [Deinococcales bacterium]